MRVLVLSPGYPLDGDHFGHVVAEQIGALGRHHDIRVQSLVPLTRPRAIRSGVEVFSPPHGGRTRRFFAIARAHAPWRPDVLWSLWVDRTGLATITLSQLLRRPALVSVMGGELARFPALGYGGRVTLRGRATARVVLRGARMVAVGSPPLRWNAERIAGARVRELPFGVDERAVPETERTPWQTGTKLRAYAIVDVSLVKGASAIFAALAWLRRQRIDAHLTVFCLTPPEGRARLRERAEHAGVGAHVEWAPPLSADEVYARLSDYHVHISASVHESQGLALIEAALANLPVVVPRVGVAEQLESLGAVRIVDSTAPEVLGPAVVEAATSRFSARRQVAAQFGIDACTARFDAALRETARCA